ncbi:MAG: hypothetical protein RLZZ234_593, partial [Candidatus Parcubacteria bacterium]
MEDVIRTALSKALATLGAAGCDFSVEHPADVSHGEYATNAALVAAKQLGKSPREVATAVVELLSGTLPHIDRPEVAGPGFINMHLTRAFFTEALTTAQGLGAGWGKNKAYSGKKVMVEYTDPNPFKELHIGHLVPNALGEALACLMEYAGAEVRRVTFQGDVGMHVAKCMYGLLHGGCAVASLTPEVLGAAYAKGATAFETDAAVADEIKALNKKIYERSDAGVNALYDKGKEVSLAYFEKAYALLGTAFNHNFFESVTGPIGRALVMSHTGTVFTESEGAIIYEG